MTRRQPSETLAALCRVVPLLTVLACGQASLAQEGMISRANARYERIAMEKRSDLIVLPAVAQMEPPPALVERPRQAALLPAGAEGWEMASAWASAGPQQAVIDALGDATEDADPQRGMAFGLPYGVSALAGEPGGLDLIEAGLYVELGDPPLLAAAEFLYLPSLDHVESLVHVEATRLAANGSVLEAEHLLIDWVIFCRQLADREMFIEARRGYRGMISGLERVRDVAYLDWRGATPSLSADDVLELLSRLRADREMRLEVLSFPSADHVAMQQIIGTVFRGDRGPEEATFASAMARLSARNKPLRLFSEAAWWDRVAEGHADGLATRSTAEGVWRDWGDNRWKRAWLDQPATPSAFDRLDPARFAVIKAVYTHQTPRGEVNPGVLLFERQRVVTEAVGTRTALSIMGYHNLTGSFPRSVFSIRPRFVQTVDADPYNDATGTPPLQYFVPWTINYRSLGPREVKQPHQTRIILEDGANFDRRIDEDQFVLYSVGPNTTDDRAVNIENSSVSNAGDYLIWPPVISLFRQNLQDQGLFGTGGS